MWFLWEIVVNTIECLLQFAFMRRMAGFTDKHQKHLALVGTALLTTILSVLNYTITDGYIVVLILTPISIVYGIVCFANSVSIRILSICLSSAITAVANQVVTFLFVQTAFGSLQILREPSAARMIPTSIYLLILAAMLALAAQLPHLSFELPRKMQCLIIALCLPTVALSAFLQSAVRITAASPDAKELYETFLAAVSVFTVGFFVALYLLVYFAEQSQEQSLAYESEMWRIRSDEEQMQLVHRWIHDERHHLAVLRVHADAGDLAAVQSYLHDMNRGLDALVPLSRTGNSTIDAVLAAKLTTAEAVNVDLQLHTGQVPDNPLTSLDTAALIGNLMDNAIEAAARWKAAGNPEAQIDVRIEAKREMLYIATSNPYIRGGRGETEKASQDAGTDHGIGLHSVRSIVQKANGYMQIEAEPQAFRVEVWIPVH